MFHSFECLLAHSILGFGIFWLPFSASLMRRRKEYIRGCRRSLFFIAKSMLMRDVFAALLRCVPNNPKLSPKIMSLFVAFVVASTNQICCYSCCPASLQLVLINIYVAACFGSNVLSSLGGRCENQQRSMSI